MPALASRRWRPTRGLATPPLGMGTAMMDFLVRESRAVVKGPMVIVRLGSCDGLTSAAAPATVVLNSPGSRLLLRNPDAFASPLDSLRDRGDRFGEASDPCADSAQQPYTLSGVVRPHRGLCEALADSLRAELGDEALIQGLNITTDSFYASQGRTDPNFDDRNEGVMQMLSDLEPAPASLEMESFTLLHLARCARRPSAEASGGIGVDHPIAAASCAIVCANRKSGAVIETAELHRVETQAGRAVLEAITAFTLGATQKQSQDPSSIV